MSTNSDGDRVLGPELAARVEALGMTVPQFAARARISKRAMNYAVQDDRPRAGREVWRKIITTLERLESGETIEEDQSYAALRVELEKGVWVTVNAEEYATLGDLRKVEEKIRRLADNGR